MQSYFAPTTTETSLEPTGSSYGSLDKTSTVNTEPEVDEWHWDHENMLDEPEQETKAKDSKTEDDGWDEWGEAGNWSNESWSDSTNDTKVKRINKKGD